MNRFLTILSALLIGSTSVFAYTNVVDDGVPVSITSTWDVGTNLWVGIETSANSLNIESGGNVTNLNTYIGNTVTSLNNRITVSSNAFLTSSANLYVGYEGGGNNLSITNGGTVQNANSYVGFGASATGNTVVVSGSNSTWNSLGDLQVGNVGNSNNSVSVLDGGTIWADTMTVHSNNVFNLEEDGELAIKNNFDADQLGFNWNGGGALTIGGELTGGISELNNDDGKTLTIWGGSWDLGTNDFVMGGLGSLNTLVLTNGGSMMSYNAEIGASGTTSNRVAVDGSKWRNSGGKMYVTGDANGVSVNGRGQLIIGDVDSEFAGIIVASSTGADLSISNNAFVETQHALYVGDGESASGTVSVGAGGKVIAESLVLAEAGTFNLNDDGTFRTINLDVSQTNFNWENGGNLEITGTFSGTNVLDGTGKLLTLDGGTWSTGTNDLIIGATGDNNALSVTNGGEAKTSGDLIVGADGTTGNSVTISSGGVVEAEDLFLKGSNQLKLTEGGTLRVMDDYSISTNSGFIWNGGGTLEVQGELTGLNSLTNAGQVLVLSTTNALWNLSGSTLNIGTAGSDNRVEISNGAVVSNQNAFVGSDSGTSNSVLVSGAESKWINTGSLTVGVSNNIGNSITVKNNGTIAGHSLTVNSNNTFNLENSGTLQITGSLDFDQDGELNWEDGGTLLMNGTLSNFTNLNGNTKTLTLVDGGSLNTAGNQFIIGEKSSTGNNLNVYSNATLTTSETQISVDGESKRNTVTIEGSGALWSNSGDLYVGYRGSYNNLKVNAEGRVETGNLIVGGDDTGSDYNTVEVGGSNAVIMTSGDLTVGRRGNGNELKVLANGAVTNQNAIIGSTVDGSDNKAIVSGDNAVWVNLQELRIGTDGNSGNSVTVINDGFIQADILNIQNGNSFFLKNDGTFRMAGNFTNTAYTAEQFVWKSGGNLSVGGALSGITNLNGGKVLTLDGTNSIWVSAAETNMTISGAGKLMVTNGATVRAGNLTVQVADSTVNISSNAWMLVGDGSTTNSLALGGLMVASTNGALLDVNKGEVIIDQTLKIGASISASGTVSVATGGTITAGALAIFPTNSAFNLENGGNLAMTTNFNASMAGFNWNNGGHLSVGGVLSGMANTLDGTDKELTLDGGKWDEGLSDITVGQNGSGNRLNIENGGFVTNANGYIGYHSNASNNIVNVSGSNSVWNNVGDLYVGYEGSSNALKVSNGGRVTNVNAFVGFTSNAWNNAVVVSGSNSVWNNIGTLTIGSADTNEGNSVAVGGAGLILASNLVVHADNAFNLNKGGTLRMTTNFNASMAGFNWGSRGNLSVGGVLSGMAVTNNFVVDGATNDYTFLSEERVLTISGAGSKWLNGGDTNLIVGFKSSNNELVISEGGMVDNAKGYIGWESTGNKVVVSDAEWRNRDGLFLSGTGNSLTATNGGWVYVGEASTTNIGGGIFVGSSSGVEMGIGKGSTVNVDTFYLGEGAAKGTVDVLAGGTVNLSTLAIANATNAFNLAGTLNVISNSFDATPEQGFNWQDDGILKMTDSDLFGISGITGSNRTVEINGGSWTTNVALELSGYQSTLSLTSTSNNAAVLTSAGAKLGTTTNDFGSKITLSGDNTTWTNSADLYIGEFGANHELTISEGAFVTNENAFVGYAASASNNSVTVTGSNSLWSIGGDLKIGVAGTGNSLSILDQAEVLIDGELKILNQGTLTHTSDKALSVGSDVTISNSTINGTGTILLGSDLVGSTLKISGTKANTKISAGIVFDAGGTNDLDKLVVSDWTLELSADRDGQYLNFEELELNQATLVGSGTFDTFKTVTMNGGVLEPFGGVLTLPSNFTVSGNPLFRITADDNNKLELTNTNSFDLADLNAEVSVNDVGDIRDFNRVILTAGIGLQTNASGVVNAFSETSFIESFPLYSFDLVYSNDQVSVTAKQALDGEISSSLAYAGSEGVRAGFNKMKSAVFTRTKQLRRNVVATAHSIPHEAFLLSNTNAPAGAMGPGDENKIFDMSIWLQQYSGQGTADAYGRSDGFTLNNNGTTIGGDRLFGDSLIAGFNYTYARSDARTTKGDTANTESYWIGGYAEWISTGGLYVDTMLAYGRTDYSTVRVLDGYRGTAKYRGKDFGGYVDVGQYYHYKNLALSPYIGVHVLSVSPDDYTEEGPKGAMNVESDTRSWMESALGLKGRYRFDTRKGRFQTTGYVEWLHDFLQQDVDSRLSVSGGGVVSTTRTARISPDSDVLNAGAGFSWICTDYMEIGIGYNGRFSERYEEHTGSMMFDIRF